MNISDIPEGGFPDTIISKINQSDLVVISGRPGNGIDALFCSIIVNASINFRIPTFVLSSEIRSDLLFKRLVSNITEVEIHRILGDRIAKHERQKFETKSQSILNAPLVVNDIHPSSILAFKIQFQELVKKHKIRLVLIDKLPFFIKQYSPHQESGLIDFLKVVKFLARQLNVSIVMIHQLGPSQSATKIFPDINELPIPIRESFDLFITPFRAELSGLKSNENGNTEVSIQNAENQTSRIFMECNPLIYKMVENKRNID